MPLVPSGDFFWPPILGMFGGQNPSTTNFTAMTAIGMQVASIFTVPQSGTIQYGGFRTGTVSGTTPQVTFSLQTVNASGAPSGTLYGGSAASAAQTVASNTQYEVALGTNATATQGDTVAAVVQCSSGTTPSIVITGDARMVATLPYSTFYNNSTYTNSTSAMALTLGYTTGYVPAPGVSAIVEGVTSTIYNSGTNPSRRALKIIAPFDMTVVGAYFIGTFAASSVVGVSLYNSSNTNLITTATSAASVAETTTGIRYIMLSTAVNLTNGSTYRLSLEPQNTNNFTDFENTFLGTYALSNPINNLIGGTAATLSTWNGSAWTDVANRRPYCGLIVSAVPQSATSGGILINPGNNGGFNQ